MREDIIDYFNYLSALTQEHITSFELTPIRIQENMYISGFRRRGIGTIEAHVQHIEHFVIKNSEFSMEVRRKTEPTAELWMDVDLLNKETVRTAFNDLKNDFYHLSTFDILHMEYREKTNSTSDYVTKEENIIFANKQLACRTVIKKRKDCISIKTKFTHFGNGQKQPSITTPMTDEEFAEMEM